MKALARLASCWRKATGTEEEADDRSQGRDASIRPFLQARFQPAKTTTTTPKKGLKGLRSLLKPHREDGIISQGRASTPGVAEALNVFTASTVSTIRLELQVAPDTTEHLEAKEVCRLLEAGKDASKGLPVPDNKGEAFAAAGDAAERQGKPQEARPGSATAQAPEEEARGAHKSSSQPLAVHANLPRRDANYNVEAAFSPVKTDGCHIGPSAGSQAMQDQLGREQTDRGQQESPHSRRTRPPVSLAKAAVAAQVSSLQKAEKVEEGGLDATQAAPDTVSGEEQVTATAAARASSAGHAALQSFSSSNERPCNYAESTGKPCSQELAHVNTCRPSSSVGATAKVFPTINAVPPPVVRETVKFAETVVAAGVPSLQQAEEAQEGGLIGAQAAQDTVNSDELVATLTPVGDEVESVASKIQPCWRHYTNRSCLEKAEEERLREEEEHVDDWLWDWTKYLRKGKGDGCISETSSSGLPEKVSEMEHESLVAQDVSTAEGTEASRASASEEDLGFLGVISSPEATACYPQLHGNRHGGFSTAGSGSLAAQASMFCVDSLDSFYIPLTTGPYGMKGSYLAQKSQRDNCWSAAASEAKAADWAGQEQDLESLDTQAQTRILAFRPSSGKQNGMPLDKAFSPLATGL